MDSEFYPTEEQQILGHTGYVRYLAGIAILNSPGSDFARGVIGDGNRKQSEIVMWAEEALMIDGLIKVIKAANPPEFDLLKAEHNFDEALPHMQDTVSAAFQLHGEQIGAMNKAFFGLRPLAVRNGVVYRAICHSNTGRLLTTTLMGGIQPAVTYREFVSGRHLREVGEIESALETSS